MAFAATRRRAAVSASAGDAATATFSEAVSVVLGSVHVPSSCGSTRVTSARVRAPTVRRSVHSVAGASGAVLPFCG